MSVQVLILAAGAGKRMGGNIPKAITPVHGKPLVSYILKAVDKAGICAQPAVVVGQNIRTVKGALEGKIYLYIYQAKQLGTGHAVQVSKAHLIKAENIFILYADHPLVAPDTLKKIADQHVANNNIVTMATIVVEDFNDWRKEFKDNFARIIRDSKNNITAIREVRDCSPEELKIMELNPAYYCLEAKWLWDNIDKLKNNNAQKEYYLTDMIDIAVGQGVAIESVAIDPKEGLGINTPEGIEQIEKILDKK